MVILSNRLQPPEILLIDDNRGDARLIEIAFKRAMPGARITLAASGEYGMSLLHAESSTIPDIVFLDLNLPTMHGLTFLELIKGDPDLRAIPVLIVTSSSAEKDVIESYRRHANGFITKPFGLEGFDRFATQVIGYWFNLVQIPIPVRARQ
jgi:two-component system response regulator